MTIQEQRGLAIQYSPDDGVWYWQDKDGYGERVSQDFSSAENAYKALLQDRVVLK